jgi:hypothetical protein
MLIAVSVSASAGVRPAGLFTDNMVIQRDTGAPVWGWADAGDEVTVTASWGATAAATAGPDGAWRVTFRTPPAGGPHTLAFKADSTVTCSDVLSGDVWLCSGQSNMAMMVRICANAEEEIRQANHPLIWIPVTNLDCPAARFRIGPNRRPRNLRRAPPGP